MFWKRNEQTDADYVSERLRMVDTQIANRGVKDSRVLAAVRSVPRHRFVPEKDRKDAYRDGPLPIGRGQTISQPYIVASMTEHLDLTPESRVLEIGTGCGYQTAVLAEIARDVYTVERIESLLKSAQANLHDLGYKNVHFHLGDGMYGWEQHAPYDGIIVTAGAPETPPALVEQLAAHGRLVIPIEERPGSYQMLYQIIKQPDGAIRRSPLYAVRFVPLKESTE